MARKTLVQRKSPARLHSFRQKAIGNPEAALDYYMDYLARSAKEDGSRPLFQPDAVQDMRDSGSCDPVMRASPHFHKRVARGPHCETFIW